MKLPSLVLLVLAVAACKTPAGKGGASELAAAKADTGILYGLECVPKGGYWELIETETRTAQISVSEKLSRSACEAVLETAGPGGYCQTRTTPASVSLVIPGYGGRSWFTSGENAVAPEFAMAECRRAAKPAAEGEFGTEGVRCNKIGEHYFAFGPNGGRFPTRYGSLKGCIQVAIGANHGRVCVPSATDGSGYEHTIIDLATNEPLKSLDVGLTRWTCQNALATSGPSGICLLLDNGPDAVISLYGSTKRTPVAQLPHPSSNNRQILQEQGFAKCQAAAMAEPTVREPPGAAQTFDGVVSRNPAFRPGTAILELAIRVGEEEIVVQIGTETNVKLDSQSDLTQLVGTSVVVTGKRESGVLVASSITEQR